MSRTGSHELAERVEEAVGIVVLEGSLRVEWVHLRPGGEAFTTDVSLNLVDEAGLVLAIIRDISALKQAETALRQANQKLNLLASITRHDMMNRLTALGGYVELTQEMTNDPDFLRELDNIKKLQADQEKLKQQTEEPAAGGAS